MKYQYPLKRAGIAHLCFSSNWLRILSKSILGVGKMGRENGTWTPLTKIAAIWVVWDLNTNGFLLLSPQIHRKKYICHSHHKTSIYPLEWLFSFKNRLKNSIYLEKCGRKSHWTWRCLLYFYLRWNPHPVDFQRYPFFPPTFWSTFRNRQLKSRGPSTNGSFLNYVVSSFADFSNNFQKKIQKKLFFKIS